jgi:hypothetical protein
MEQTAAHYRKLVSSLPQATFTPVSLQELVDLRSLVSAKLLVGWPGGAWYGTCEAVRLTYPRCSMHTRGVEAA